MPWGRAKRRERGLNGPGRHLSKLPHLQAFWRIPGWRSCSSATTMLRLATLQRHMHPVTTTSRARTWPSRSSSSIAMVMLRTFSGKSLRHWKLVGTSHSLRAARLLHVYLIWALAMLDAPPAARAANFFAFLGEKHSAQDLADLTALASRALLGKVEAGLAKADFPCRSLGKIRAIHELLHPN